MKSSNGNRELAVLMDKAEVMWIKEIQIQLVEDHNFQKWKSQLQLYVDNLGIWRCRGRLMNARITQNTRLYCQDGTLLPLYLLEGLMSTSFITV